MSLDKFKIYIHYDTLLASTNGITAAKYRPATLSSRKLCLLQICWSRVRKNVHGVSIFCLSFFSPRYERNTEYPCLTQN